MLATSFVAFGSVFGFGFGEKHDICWWFWLTSDEIICFPVGCTSVNFSDTQIKKSKTSIVDWLKFIGYSKK